MHLFAVHLAYTVLFTYLQACNVLIIINLSQLLYSAALKMSPISVLSPYSQNYIFAGYKAMCIFLQNLFDFYTAISRDQYINIFIYTYSIYILLARAGGQLKT
jgi:hypothetical protein